jgi:hypothetical protein
MASTTPTEDLRAAYATPGSLWLALGGPERSERRFRAAWIAFCLACGVLATLNGIGYTLVVGIVTAMMAYGLGRLGWRAVRGVFR